MLQSKYVLTNDDCKILQTALSYVHDPNEHFIQNASVNHQYRKKLDVLRKVVAELETQEKAYLDFRDLVERIEKAGFSDG